jgi:excisionase family DNA binding protein
MNIELCRAEEVADALGIKLDTLYRYARRGRIRGMKVGKGWRFLQADIQDFLHEHEYRVKPSEHPMRDEIKPTLLPDILRRAAAESEVRRAVGCGGAEASYADLDRASNLLADSLLGRGVVPGDRVVILLPNSLEFVAACFAVWKAGAIVVAEDPSIHDKSLCSLLQDCTPQALIVDRSVAERLDARRHGLRKVLVVYVKGRTFRLSGLEGVRVDSLDTALENNTSPVLLRFNSASPDEVATLTYNIGGDSERARGVMNTHKNWLSGAAFTDEYLALTQQDILVLPVPLHESLALRQMLAGVLAGARILLASDLDGAVKAMKGQLPTALTLRPDQVKPLLEKFSAALQKLAGTLRHVQIAAGPLEEKNIESLRRLLPRTMIHRSRNLTEAHCGFFGPGGSENGVCRTAPTLKLRVVDEYGRHVPAGHAGRVMLNGPGLMKGFWGQSEHEMAMLNLHGYCNGDWAVADEHGGVTLLERTEETLQIRGQKVNPAEIEAVLRRHDGVAECAVTGLLEANGKLETALHAFVAPTARGTLLSERDLKTYCRAFLQPHKVPVRIHFHASLPKSADGRVLRETLKAAAQFAADGELGKAQSGFSEFLIPPC